MSRPSISSFRAEIAAANARADAFEADRDQMIVLLQWYAASRRRWMEAHESGSSYIYRQTGATLREPEEEMPAPIGCVNRPEFRYVERYERSEEASDLDDYARDINSW